MPVLRSDSDNTNAPARRTTLAYADEHILGDELSLVRVNRKQITGLFNMPDFRLLQNMDLLFRGSLLPAREQFLLAAFAEP